MSLFKAAKKFTRAVARTPLLAVDVALDSCGVNILKQRRSVSFTYDRLEDIGRDLKDAFEETFDD